MYKTQLLHYLIKFFMVQCCSTIHTVVHEFILNINLWVDPHAVTLHIESRQIHFF